MDNKIWQMFSSFFSWTVHDQGIQLSNYCWPSFPAIHQIEVAWVLGWPPHPYSGITCPGIEVGDVRPQRPRFSDTEIRLKSDSLRFRSCFHLPFRQPKAFSTTILAELNWWLKHCCSWEIPGWCVNPFLSCGWRGYAGFPNQEYWNLDTIDDSCILSI